MNQQRKCYIPTSVNLFSLRSEPQRTVEGGPAYFNWIYKILQFSHSVMSNSLQPHGLQHARPPCPSPTPRVYPNSRPSSVTSSSVIPFSSGLQSFPASGFDLIHLQLVAKYILQCGRHFQVLKYLKYVNKGKHDHMGTDINTDD